MRRKKIRGKSLMNRDQYWLNLCKAIASNSKCLSRKLGAVIVKDNSFIISTGYNGPPAKCKHCEWRDDKGAIYGDHKLGGWNDVKPNYICPRKRMGFQSGEGLEFCFAAHAERNAISIAAKLGHSTDNCSMYLDWIIPCFECCKSLINAGIKEVIVVNLENYDKKGITGRQLLEQAGVRIRAYEINS